MQNVDLVLLLQPLLALAISLGALVFWWFGKGFRGAILLVSAAAYFLAIGAKVVIQTPTLNLVEARFGQESVGLGLYYGLQTVLLEVGLAYLFARYAARRWKLQSSAGVPYGLALSFWENGVLLGLLPIFNLGVIYLLLASSTTTAASTYSQLVATQPSLFEPPATLLPLVLIGTLERISSMLVHLAWGMLCIFSPVTGRKRYLAYALPMGLVDATVPFASLNTDLFEAAIFALSLFFILIAWRASKGVAAQTAAPAVVGA